MVSGNQGDKALLMGIAYLKLVAVLVTFLAGWLVSGVVSAADADVYGSIRLAVLYSDTGEAGSASDDITMSDESSRVGLQGNETLGDVTAFARWEWGVEADSQNSRLNTRLGYIGLSGGFGTVSFGSQWSAWDTYVGGDHTNIVSEGIWHNGTKRNGDSLKYAGKIGPVSIEADAVLAARVASDINGDGVVGETERQNSGPLDEVQLAFGYSNGPFVVQAGVITRDGGANGYLGGGTLIGGRVTYEREKLILSAALARDDDEFGGAEETTGLKLRAGYRTGPNRFLLVVTQSNNNVADNNPNGIALGYQYDLSKRSRVALEMSSVDPDIAGPDSSIEGGVMYRHDW